MIFGRMPLPEKRAIHIALSIFGFASGVRTYLRSNISQDKEFQSVCCGLNFQQRIPICTCFNPERWSLRGQAGTASGGRLQPNPQKKVRSPALLFQFQVNLVELPAIEFKDYRTLYSIKWHRLQPAEFGLCKGYSGTCKNSPMQRLLQKGTYALTSI